MNANHQHLPEHDTAGSSELSSVDQASVDAWLEARAAGGSADLPALDLLASQERPDPSLTDVTLARIFRTRAAAAGGGGALSPDDAEALDAWILAEQHSSRVHGSLRARAERIETFGAMVRSTPRRVAAPDLADRTLAHIQRHIETRDAAYRLAIPRKSRARGIRLLDLVSVAAAVLVGSAVVLPMIASARDSQRRALCNANLGQTAVAMSSYAGANRDALPMATAGLGGSRWWDVTPEQPHSNSANLFALARNKYINVGQLACPGNPFAPRCQTSEDAFDWRRLEEVSYSYQIMFGPRPTWNSPQRTVILADRSPIILAAVRGESVSPTANTPNHGYRGQHLLLTDGSTSWHRNPVLDNGDNIWLPRSVEQRISELQGRPVPLQGRELPDGVDDVFLGP